MKKTLCRIALCCIVLTLVLLTAGCGEELSNTDWATRLTATENGGDELQQALDVYAGALVSKDRDEFLSVVDPENVAFTQGQDAIFTNLQEVPFADYRISVTSKSEAGADTFLVKVDIAYTLDGSFDKLPEPERAAFYMVRKESGWKLSGDASLQALGKPRDAGLEDFGPVVVTEGAHVIVLSHAAASGLAAQIRDLSDAAYPRLQETIPGLDMPKVPIRLFDDMGQIEKAYPGGWQEWTGGASRPLGADAGQGGEIIVDAGTYREAESYGDGYNGRMLGHELTHVALFPESDVRTPPFLVEGLADYVGGIEPVILLREKLRSGESFSPVLSDLYQPSGFSTLLTTEAATLAYEESDLAVEYLVNTYGSEAVIDLLRQFKERSYDDTDQSQLVDEVFRDVLGVSWDEFENAWRDYVLRG